MDYTHLTPNDFVGLRRERITALEGEHYRLMLLLHEVEDLTSPVAQQLGAQSLDIERRIALHIEQLERESTSADTSD